MTPFASPEEVPQPLPTFDHRVEAAYRLLRAAQDSAKAAGRPSWEFAVEIEELRALGLSSTDLRSLLCAGYVLHGVERYDPGSRLRIFRHFTSLALPKGSCFVLTEKGLQGFGHPPAPGPLPAAARGPGVSRKDQSVGDRPCWDGALRELRWGGRLVKRFRVPAMNQEAILAALEEEGWPPHILDPLPPVAGVDSKARLRNAIKHLNRHQINPLLCFRGDGTGTGVLWILIGSESPTYFRDK